MIILTSKVDLLANKIDKRFEAMISMGVIEEVQRVLSDIGNVETLGAFKAIGAKEIIQFLNNGISFEQLKLAMTQKTKQYAKKQRTWFRNKLVGWNTISIDSFPDIKLLAQHIDNMH